MAAYYTFEDLCGSAAGGTKTDNPYHDLIESCNNDAVQIQHRYDTHRTARNAQQKSKLLAPDFPGVTVDEILAKLEAPDQFPGFEDPRHCLVFWARPTRDVKKLIAWVQERVSEVVPGLWLMPPDSLHMTALEITHSRSAADVDALVARLRPAVAPAIVQLPRTRRARLVRPALSFDAQALALSFLPAADDGYTYHHLRRDLFALASGSGVRVASRYVIPSAHLTIGRFVRTGDFEVEGAEGKGRVDRKKVEGLVERIEGVNRELREGYWPREDGGEGRAGAEWVIGSEKGLEFRKGALWYGSGGETVLLGEGS